MTDVSAEVSDAAQTPSNPDVPEAGQLVRVRGQQWVVSNVNNSHQPADEIAATRLPGRTLITLTSVSDDDLGEELTVVWEVEPGREIVPATQLPQVTETSWDDPQTLGAFLDAVRWGTIASADTKTLQAPFRSGIIIEEYQLEPVARALAMPRVNLLIADDVGLGKTIEAGLVVQEMLLRHRARRVIVVCPASLTLKWQEEMEAKFGLGFQILDTDQLRELRRSHGLEANPFAVYPRTIISLQWLRTPRVQRMLDEVLTSETRFPGFFDLLIVDEVHHCAPAEPPKEHGYPVESKQTQAVRRLSEHSQHRLFLSATPHNGYSWSWQALLEMLDPQRFFKGREPDKADPRPGHDPPPQDRHQEPRRHRALPRPPDQRHRHHLHRRRARGLRPAPALHRRPPRQSPRGRGPRRRPGHAHPQEAPLLLTRRLRAHA